MIDMSTIDCEGAKGKYIGKHAGACKGKDVEGNPCTFSLMSYADTRCPKCGSNVEKEES